jgi:hypothetical protein
MINNSMNYQTIYNTIIERSRNRVLTEYSEEHHIIPRCLGGSSDKSNLALLTPEEHYLCHLLLVKLNPNNIRLVKAAMFMVSGTKYVRRSNKMYGWLKRQYSDYMRGPNNPSKLNGTWNKGLSVKLRKTDITDEEKQNHSIRMKEKNPCAGVKPWNHPRATEYTRSIWIKADVIYNVWLENNKPSYCRLHSLVRGCMYDTVSVGPFMNMVKYFRNGWIPTQDIEWKEFKEKQ